jgi:hypothetical protein
VGEEGERGGAPETEEVVAELEVVQAARDSGRGVATALSDDDGSEALAQC